MTIPIIDIHCSVPIKYALRILSKRDYTISEMKKKMKLKGYEPKEVDEAIKKLLDWNYLNEDRAAKSTIRKYGSSKGNRFIIQKLRERGIKPDDYQEEVDLLDSELDRALAFIKKKVTQKGELQENKILSGLAYRGFSSATCFKALKQYKAYLADQN